MLRRNTATQISRNALLDVISAGEQAAPPFFASDHPDR